MTPAQQRHFRRVRIRRLYRVGWTADQVRQVTGYPILSILSARPPGLGACSCGRPGGHAGKCGGQKPAHVVRSTRPDMSVRAALVKAFMSGDVETFAAASQKLRAWLRENHLESDGRKGDR